MKTQDPKEVELESAGRGAAWVFKSLFAFAVISTLACTAAGGAVIWHFSKSLPEIITIADYKPPTVTTILGGNGREDELLAEFYVERRYVIPYEKIPPKAVFAFVAAEDDQFFEHPGINLSSIIRAS